MDAGSKMKWGQLPSMEMVAALLGRRQGLCCFLWKKQGKNPLHQSSDRESVPLSYQDRQRAAICPLSCTPCFPLKPQEVIALL